MIEERVPFRSLVPEESFRRPGMPDLNIFTLADNPEVIVRGGFHNEYDSVRDINDYFQEHLDNRVALHKLRDNYGLFIPDFFVTVGGNNRFFIVTQRIHGLNLHERQFKPEETGEAREKLSRFYTSLADVLIDTCTSGGLMVADLVRAGANTSGNKQWVYEKRKGDSENQVWLADLGPAVWDFDPHDQLFFQKLFPYLFEMIIETEGKLSCKFDIVRKKLLDYMQVERSSFSDDDLRSKEIDRFFRLNRWIGRI